MGIDRRRVKEKAEEAKAAPKPETKIEQLEREFRAVATVGELRALLPKLQRLTKQRQRRKKILKPGPQGKRVKNNFVGAEAEAVDLMYGMLEAVERYDDDEPITEADWTGLRYDEEAGECRIPQRPFEKLNVFRLRDIWENHRDMS